MNNNLKIAEEILKYIGGEENVVDVFHCATRLRFHLKDDKKVDEALLKKTDGIMGIMNAGGMYQIIIGQNVELVFEQFISLGNFKKGDISGEFIEEESTEKEKWSAKGIVNSIMTYIAASVTPIIYPLLGAALWNTIGMILGPGVLNIISYESGFYITTQILYNALFYFLPIYVGYSAAKALKMSNPVWGMLAGCLIVTPTFVSMVGTVENLSLFSLISVPVADYGQSLLPVLIGVWILSYLYKFLSKIIPTILFGTIAPIIIFFVMAIVMFWICAPLGTFIGEGISNLFMSMANSVLPIRILAFALLTGLWPIITMFGMHLPIILTAIGLMPASGQDVFVLVCSITSLFFIYGMSLGAFFKFKKKENKITAISAFFSGFVGAICEPILYGVCLKSKSSIRVMVIGGAIMGVLISLLQPIFYNIGAVNIFALFIMYAGGTSSNLIIGIGLGLFAVICGALGVILFAKYDEENF